MSNIIYSQTFFKWYYFPEHNGREFYFIGSLIQGFFVESIYEMESIHYQGIIHKNRSVLCNKVRYSRAALCHRNAVVEFLPIVAIGHMYGTITVGNIRVFINPHGPRVEE